MYMPTSLSSCIAERFGLLLVFVLELFLRVGGKPRISTGVEAGLRYCMQFSVNAWEVMMSQTAYHNTPLDPRMPETPRDLDRSPLSNQRVKTT